MGVCNDLFQIDLPLDINGTDGKKREEKLMRTKKMLALLLSFALILVNVPMTRAADALPTLRVVASENCVAIGDMVTFTVYLSDADKTTGIWNYTFDVVFSDGLSYYSCEIPYEARSVFSGVDFNADTMKVLAWAH